MTDYAFPTKVVTSSLFGVIEAEDQEPWLSAFANAPTTVFTVDVAIFDAIAEDLKLDFNGQAYSAHRYLSGQHRVGTGGLGASEVGTLGEVLTYLHCRSSGYDIQRVIGSDAAGEQGRFPEPDYLVLRHGELEAWEVKSTEALSFLEYSSVNHWKHLKHCRCFSDLRAAALEQLGFVEGVLTKYEHQLRLARGDVVPFPVTRGTAVAVALMDGRLNLLRQEERLRTPPACRGKRSCWSCVPKEVVAAMGIFHNAPGHLSLAGSEGRPVEWFDAYRRWEQSLRSLDQETVDKAATALVESTDQWLATITPDHDILRGYWGSHIGDRYRDNGLDSERTVARGRLSERREGWRRRPQVQVERVKSATFPRQTTREQTNRFALDDGEEDGRYSVEIDDNEWHIRLLSNTWLLRGETSDEDANLIARQLVGRAVLLTTGSGGLSGELAMRRIEAGINGRMVHLGWTSAVSRPWPLVWPFARSYPPWLFALALGDPRIALTVFLDGRAHLRIDRSLAERAA